MRRKMPNSAEGQAGGRNAMQPAAAAGAQSRQEPNPDSHQLQSRRRPIQANPDSHQLEQIAENSASLLQFVKRRERGRGGPATAEPIPDSHQLEQIAEGQSRQSPIGADCGEFGKFVAICEAEGERPRRAGDGGRREKEWLPRVHFPLGEGRGRDHAELRRARPGFRESEIDGMNGEGGRLSRRLGGRLKCRAASGGRGRPEPNPDSHQLEQIAENSASLLRFVKRRERGRGGPATGGGERRNGCRGSTPRLVREGGGIISNCGGVSPGSASRRLTA